MSQIRLKSEIHFCFKSEILFNESEYCKNFEFNISAPQLTLHEVLNRG